MSYMAVSSLLFNVSLIFIFLFAKNIKHALTFNCIFFVLFKVIFQFLEVVKGFEDMMFSTEVVKPMCLRYLVSFIIIWHFF